MPKRAREVGIGQKVSAEALGTFFVTLTAASVDVLYYTGDQVDFVSRWLARGLMTAVLIYALSDVSGAHLNPVVSLAFAIRRAMRWPVAALYCLGQFVGGFAAALLVKVVWPSQAVLGASHPGTHYSQLTAACTEAVLTALVIGVILATADPKGSIGKQAALAVGFSIAACGFFAGPISGASMNPARSITTQIISGADGIIWIYIVGPLVGAVIAALGAYALLGPPDEGEHEAATGGG